MANSPQEAGHVTGTAPDASPGKESFLSRSYGAFRDMCFNVGVVALVFAAVGLTVSVLDEGRMARAALSGFGTFVASIGDDGSKLDGQKDVAGKFEFVASAKAQSQPPTAKPTEPVAAASGSASTNLDKEAEKIVSGGKPSVVPVPTDAMAPKKFLGNVSLYSTEEIRKSIDWLKDRVTVALRALEQALYGLVWSMNEQNKDAFDIKFFQDVEKKLSDMLESWQAAMTKRWGEGVTLASKDRGDNDLKKLQRESAENKAKIAAVEGELAQAKESLGGLVVGVPAIDAVVQIDFHNRRVVDVYDATSGQSLIDVVYFNEHQTKKDSHWAISKLAFVTWAQKPGESGTHHVIWQFNTGYRPGVACPHAPTNKCVRVYASDPASGYYDAKGAARELVRQGLSKAESSALMDQRKKNVKE